MAKHVSSDHPEGPTCRVVGMMRLRPSMEMLTAMLMPAKRRLLFPMIDCRALFTIYGIDTQGHIYIGLNTITMTEYR